jgi:hypothetical protein
MQLWERASAFAESYGGQVLAICPPSAWRNKGRIKRKNRLQAGSYIARRSVEDSLRFTP